MPGKTSPEIFSYTKTPLKYDGHCSAPQQFSHLRDEKTAGKAAAGIAGVGLQRPTCHGGVGSS
jgi:hypothetical protein